MPVAEQRRIARIPATPSTDRDLSTKRAKPRKPAKTRQSAATQALILTRAASGQSKREIAREMNLDRGTVANVLSQPEIEQAIEQFRARLIALFSKAAQAVEQSLDAGDGRLGLMLAKEMGATLAANEESSKPRIVINIICDRKPNPVVIPTKPPLDFAPQQPKLLPQSASGGQPPDWDAPEQLKEDRVNYARAVRDVSRAIAPRRL